MKVKVKFVGVNSNSHKCYITQQGSYLAEINGEFYTLNQCQQERFISIKGKPIFKIDKNKLEIVNEF